MTKRNCVVCLTLFALAGGAIAEEHDYYRYLRYPAKLVPGIGRNKVEQAGGADAVGYKRRTVQWWPRKGQDIVDIPKGAPLRTWTRNKGQKDKEALAGVSRHWTASAPETFKAHLIGFRGFGTSTVKPDPSNVLIPAAVLRLENGEQRSVVDYGPVSKMMSPEDHIFIHKVWEKAFPKLYAQVSQEDRLGPEVDFKWKLWEGPMPKFNGIEVPRGSKYPRWGIGENGISVVVETPNFYLIARPKHWGKPASWIQPNNIEGQNRYRKSIMEYLENFWTYVEAAGASMPYWRRSGPNKKYQIHIWRSRCAGGWGHCGIGDASPVAFGHEFFHGQPLGGWGGAAETMCNSGQHTALPGELQMFNGNFRYPWRNVMNMGYQSSLWFFVLGDNPNWGYGIQVVVGCLSSSSDITPYHALARLGQERGLWKNGIKGFGDFFGEYAARMVTCDFVERYPIQSKYGMPEMSYVYPVYGHKNRYRINNAEAPRWCGYNIIRLNAAQGAKEITADFQGIHDPAQHSDWRACIVAVDANGRARYSPLWNKGKMTFALKPTDKKLWFTVSACPSAFPVPPKGRRVSIHGMFLSGIHAPRHLWEVTLTGCAPGTPHRKQGDIVNFDELYGRCDTENTYLNYPVKHEVPIPLTEKDGKIAQEKLADLATRIKASGDALQEKVDAGKAHRGYFWSKKTMRLGDMADRVKFLQKNAKGHRHPNGGGFVSDNSKVAATAYVGPGAMVLDGATVKDNACIKDFAVVLGPKMVVSGNAKIGGRAWVCGDLTVSGNARILEAATVTTLMRTPRTPSRRYEGKAEITGSAVIKGEHFLHLIAPTGQTVTGGVVVDYIPTLHNRKPGVFKYGRYYQEHHRRVPSFGGGTDAGGLYANWQFDQLKAVLLEDAYVNNNGTLYGRPKFEKDGTRKCIVFNGTNQYAQAPPSVADFSELTIDMLINRFGDKGGRLFDFGTDADERFYLAIGGQNGKPSLIAKHKGKSYSVTASQGIPAGKWARVRVEMDGATASIYIDGKQVARKGFAFSSRDVFIGDLPEGNFIACGRDKKEFFTGKMDHFRIYRKVHKDFETLAPAPFPLVLTQDWSEEDQMLSDAWAARRKAKEEEIKAGEYGQIQKQIREFHTKKSALSRTDKLKELEDRARKADQAGHALDRKLHEGLRVLPEVSKAEKEIRVLHEKINAISNKLRNSAECKKLQDDIRACEQKRGGVEKEVCESPKLKAIAAKIDALGKQRQKAEERIKELPELKKLKAAAEQEKDNKKKNELKNKYNRLLSTKRSTDSEYQKAEIAGKRFSRQQQETLRWEIETHAGRERLEGQIRKLRQKLDALNKRLRESNPELVGLQKTVSAKQTDLNKKRAEFEKQYRARTAGDYKQAEANRVAARKATDDERKRLAESTKPQAAEIDVQIAKLQTQTTALWNSELKKAGLAGRNPYPGAETARQQDIRRQLKWHATADWSGKILGDGKDDDSEALLKMKKWLTRVRGH